MPVRIAVRACFIVFSLTLATLAGDQSDPQWGEAALECRLSISVAKSSYQVGEPIAVNTVLKNFGKAKAYVLVAQQRTMFRMQVLGPGGKQVPLTAAGRRQADEPQSGSGALVHLDSGETDTREFKDLITTYELATPGEYTVIMTRFVYSDEVPKGVSIGSNRLTIKVIENVPTTQPR